MIPGDLAARLRMLTEASFFDSEPAVQGTAKIRELQARLPQLLPGQPFSATIQRPLPDGTFQAIVAGRTYTLALNHAAKAGDSLELVVTKNTPNAVFAQLATPGATTGAEAGNRPTLSATGQLISFLLTGQPTPAAPQLAAGKPLLATPPAAGGAQLAPMLKQALAQSGLFYESHQLKWLSGKLDSAALMREPQGQAGAGAQRPGTPGAPTPGASTAQAQPAAAAPATSTAAQAGAARLSSNMAAITGISQSAETDGRTERLSEALRSATQTRAAAIPDRVLPLVHQQLDSMATQNYVVHGQAWPGQAFEWEIEDHQGEQGEEEDTSEDWNTTLRLTMPHLGTVEARMQITPAGVALRLVTDSADSAAALDAAREQLDLALAASDVVLTGFVVEQRRDE